MNLEDMKAIVRRDLRDEDEDAYRWSDDEIERHIAHAVKDYSGAAPLEQTADIGTTAGSRTIDISELADRILVEAVEFPAGQFPPRYQRFALWGQALTLLGDEAPDGSEARVHYGSLHTLDAESSTIPAWHEDLVAAGACGYAAIEMAVYTMNRVNTGGAGTPDALSAWGKERLDYFRSELKRLGRQNTVRVRSLYRPYTAPVSKSTDGGP
jgi:hypothetical protein